MMLIAPITDNDVPWGKFATIIGTKTLILRPKLKQVVPQYKMWNEVMLSGLTQMMCYNVYIPLLRIQTNDVEQNTNPIIFDVIGHFYTRGRIISIWTYLGKHLQPIRLCVSSIKTGTRRI